MPRRPQIRYFASRKAYYCQISKKQIRLASGPDDYPDGPTYRAAAKAFAEEIEKSTAPRSGQRNKLRTLCNLFIERHKDRWHPSSAKRFISLLRPLIQAEGDRLIAHFGHTTLNTFLEQQRQPRAVKLPHTDRPHYRSWGDTSVFDFVNLIIRIMRWATKNRLIDYNPLEGYSLPAKPHCVRDFLVSRQLHEAALALCVGRRLHFRAFLICLEATGARQGELLAAEARFWDTQRLALVYRSDRTRRPGDFRHKSARHKDRFIYFSGEALAVIEQLRQQHPEGALFRNGRGQPLCKANVDTFFHRLQQRLNAPGFTPHSYRHTFVTHWLTSNPNIDILAQLIGDNPATIRKHYSHLCEQWEGVRSSLEAFRSSRGCPPNPPPVAEAPPCTPPAEHGPDSAV